MREALLIGAAPGDGTGDPARTGGQKVNDNFAELYAFLGGDTLTQTAGSVLLGNGTGALSSFATTAGRVMIGGGASGPADDANLKWNSGTPGLTIGGATTTTQVDVRKSDDSFGFSGTGIARFTINNGTGGIELFANGIRAYGTDTDRPLWIQAAGAGDVTISSPSGSIIFGAVYFTGDTLNVDRSLNSDNEILYVNYYGYNASSTRYRDLLICDGRTHGILHVVGAATPIFRPETAELVALGTSGTQFSDLYLGNGTNTTAGVSATINKATGRFRLSSGSTAFTLTNSHISAGDTVICQPCQNDATGTVKNVVPAGGSAVINFVAPTSDMDVQFQVIRN